MLHARNQFVIYVMFLGDHKSLPFPVLTMTALTVEHAKKATPSGGLQADSTVYLHQDKFEPEYHIQPHPAVEDAKNSHLSLSSHPCVHL